MIKNKHQQKTYLQLLNEPHVDRCHDHFPLPNNMVENHKIEHHEYEVWPSSNLRVHLVSLRPPNNVLKRKCFFIS